MTTQNEWITIGSHFADKMGYEDLVGATALVQEKRTAITQVAVMPHMASASFQVIDIHSEDVIYEEKKEEPRFCGIINLTSSHIYYTTNSRLQDFLKTEMRYQSLILFSNAKDIHQILSNISDEHPKRDFFIHNLDAPADRHLLSLQETLRTRPSMPSIWPSIQ